MEDGGGEVEKGVCWEKVEDKPKNASFLALLAYTRDDKLIHLVSYGVLHGMPRRRVVGCPIK